MSEPTDTAHEVWDARWGCDAGRADWLVPEIAVQATAHAAYNNGARTALDLGSGVGRHALMLAEIGFETHALDASETGIETLRAEATARGLEVDARVGRMTALPYAESAFDYVLAYNVIYHGDRAVVAQTIAEIARVLTPGGLYHGTMLSKRNAGFGVGREVGADAWVRSAEGDGDGDGEPLSDKAHPHFYCDAGGLVALFEGFELWSLEDRLHAKPGSWHWHLTAERRA